MLRLLLCLTVSCDERHSELGLLIAQCQMVRMHRAEMSLSCTSMTSAGAPLAARDARISLDAIDRKIRNCFYSNTMQKNLYATEAFQYPLAFSSIRNPLMTCSWKAPVHGW